MCQACLEAELWLAYQEELAARDTGGGGSSIAGPGGAADAQAAAERPVQAFACEEPSST
jgi:hypothetical protein